VKEVKMGYECGAMIENFNDIKVDDVIEGFIISLKFSIIAPHS
jgi:translation initiation factor IF-2